MMSMGIALHRIKAALAYAAAAVMLLGFNATAFANESPTDDYVTDSSHILISEADSSIADVAALLDGDYPSDVLDDSSLDGYSTLTIFSVTGIDDYDFSETEETTVRGASITSDMTLQIRFLPTDGEWEKLDFTYGDDYMTIEFPSEGQLAIFALDEVDIEDDELKTIDSAKDAGKAPQTGDALLFIITIGTAAAFGVIVSYRKLHK